MTAQHQCSIYKELGNLAKRSPNYFQDAVPLCDSYLKRDWYVAIHYDMPTTAPDLGYCGTTYPYWLNGNDKLSNMHIKIASFFLQNIEVFLYIFTFHIVILHHFVFFYSKDTLPDIPKSSKWAKVCQVGFEGPCTTHNHIWITNCEKYFVYELLPLDICSSAYCFGKKCFHQEKSTFFA